jgi:hypothetical protein
MKKEAWIVSPGLYKTVNDDAKPKRKVSSIINPAPQKVTMYLSQLKTLWGLHGVDNRHEDPPI